MNCTTPKQTFSLVPARIRQHIMIREENYHVVGSNSRCEASLIYRVPQIFVPHCACWVEETSVSRPLVMGNEDAGNEGGLQLSITTRHHEVWRKLHRRVSNSIAYSCSAAIFWALILVRIIKALFLTFIFSWVVRSSSTWLSPAISRSRRK